MASKSTRKRDETIKRALYERAGVSESWTIDPDKDIVHVYRNSAEGCGKPLELRRDPGSKLTTTLLPGLEISLERIFGTEPAKPESP